VSFFCFLVFFSFLFLNFSLVEKVGCRLGQQLQSWCYIRLSPSALRLRQNAINNFFFFFLNALVFILNIQILSNSRVRIGPK
jgi:hypothetical protein